MKYRRLTVEELSGLENEFINFLIINGIDAQEWDKIKNHDAGKAEMMLDIFSDMVFDGIIDKVSYLEHFGKDGYKLFKCEDDIIKLTGIIPPELFSSVQDMMEHLKVNPGVYQIFHTSKAYLPDKKSEIFRMISSGAVITDGEIYEQFQNL